MVDPNFNWLAQHGTEYLGKWVALYRGDLIDDDESLKPLTARLQADHSRLFDRQKITLVFIPKEGGSRLNVAIRPAYSAGSCNFCNQEVYPGTTVTEVRSANNGGLVVRFCSDCLQQLKEQT